MIRRVAGNVGALLATQGLALMERVVLVGILVRMWGADLYADWATLSATAGLVVLGELGLGIYFGNAWQSAVACGDRAKVVRLVRLSIACTALIGVLLLALSVTFVALGLPSALLVLRVLSPADAALVLLLLATAGIGSIVRGGVTQVYRGKGEFARGILVSSVPLALYVVLAVVAASAGATPVALAALYPVCELIGAAVLLRDLRRRYPELVLAPAKPTAAELAEIGRYTKWNAVLMNAPVALTHVPVLLLGVAGASGAALVSFVLLRTLANYTRSLSTLLALSTTVEMAPLLLREDKQRLAVMLGTTGTTISVFAAGLCIALLLLGEDLVGLWTGRRELFDRATAAMLLAAAMASAAAAPLNALFMYGNRPRAAALGSLMQLAVSLAACALGASTHGTRGAAAGLLLGELVVSCAVVPMAAKRHFGIEPWRYLWRCSAAALLTAGWCGCVLVLTIELVGAGHALGLVLCAASFGMLGLAPAALASLPQTHRVAIRDGVLRLVERARSRAAAAEPFRLKAARSEIERAGTANQRSRDIT